MKNQEEINKIHTELTLEQKLIYEFYYSPYTKPHFHPGLQRQDPPFSFSGSSNTVARWLKSKIMPMTRDHLPDLFKKSMFTFVSFHSSPLLQFPNFHTRV